MTRLAAISAVLLSLPTLARADEPPEALAPFSHLIGGWNGTAIPSANKLKGWKETHRWAWKFEKGTPVGLSMELTGDKTLGKGALKFDAAKKTYTLDATDPEGKPATYVGAIDKAGKALVLSRSIPATKAKERLSLFLNSNKIRYGLLLERQEAGAPQYAKIIDVGMTKEGEAFAAGGAAADLPKCIITGGSASMTVSHAGKSYPICCSGCRDEFEGNPEKYVAKLATAAAKVDKGTAKPASSSKDDGAFDGLIEKPKKP